MSFRLAPRVAVLAATCILNLTTARADDPALAAAAPAQSGDPAATPALPVASAMIAAPTVAGAGSSFEIADRVVVRKGARRLLLMQDDRIVADYPVRLGLNPVGPKEREGDFRTPEGTYWLTRRNSYSDFFLSIEVSYPNESDRSRAQRLRAPPGGSIMIHGQPNFPRKPSDYYARNDWTDGCIAVSNSDMVDIWLRTRIGLPIEIRP
jgi:murein L,D-transpeptidase YafK